MKRSALVALICILAGGIWYAATRGAGMPMPDILVSAPTPTPIPYADMTIPYLRARSYSSALSVGEVIARQSQYTSYRTSFMSDGLKEYGLLTVPNGAATEKYLAIVFVHGYIPPAEYRTAERYAAYVEYLARNGFIVFKIDLRGHDQSEGEASGAYYSSGYVIDALNARAALAGYERVDRGRIGLWGHSMAGNVVMRALVARPEIPAVAIWAGAGYTYADLAAYRLTDASYRPHPAVTGRLRSRDEMRQLYGQFSQKSPFWKQVAVTDYLKDIRGAVELHHAVDDPVVSIEYSRNLKRLLDMTSVPHRLYEYPGGGHNISDPYFTTAMERTVEFFRKYL